MTPPADMSLTELRRRRGELQHADDAVSYVRRVAHGRADLVRDAIARLSDDGDPTPVYLRRDLQGELRDVLSDRLLAGDGRPPRPAEDFSGHPLAAELDRLCAEHGYHRLDRLERAELEALLAALDGFASDVSGQRKQLHAELDALTEELVVRLADEQSGNSD